MQNTKNNKVDYDIIIIGAGLSGICLAMELVKRTEFSILVLEQKTQLIKDKNWCFWNYPKNILSENYNHSWEEIKIKIKGENIIKKGRDLKYLRISSNCFYDLGIATLQKKKKFKILFGNKIKKINEKNNRVEVLSNNKRISSSLLFNSIPQAIEKNKLKQHFLGIEVNTNKAVFNSSEVTLMDFQKNNKEVHFFYILPFSDKTALIETTYFSKSIYNKKKYRADIEKYLTKKYPNINFTYGFIEKGVLPMYFNYTKYNSQRIIPIGQTNNWIKISTGYCFQNAFEKSQQIVDCILKEKKISIKQRFSNKILDEIFCEYICRYPESVPKFFYKFFNNLELKIIVMFLTEKQTMSQIIKILLVLPKIKLISSFLYLLVKKLSYAFRH